MSLERSSTLLGELREKQAAARARMTVAQSRSGRRPMRASTMLKKEKEGTLYKHTQFPTRDAGPSDPAVEERQSIRSLEGHKMAEAKAPLLSKTDKAVLRGTGVLSLGLGSALGIEGGLERLLGAKRFAHGTSAEAAGKIRRTGLDPAFGGAPSGASSVMKDVVLESYPEASKRKVHVFTGLGRRDRARQFSAAIEEAAKHPPGKGSQEVEAAFAFGRGGKKGLVEGAIPVEKLKNFSLDPDYLDPSNAKALRGNVKIDPKYITEGRASLRAIIKGRTADLPKYIKSNPKRFFTGLGLAVALPTLSALGMYHLTKPVWKKKTAAIKDVGIMSPVTAKEQRKQKRETERLRKRSGSPEFTPIPALFKTAMPAMVEELGELNALDPVQLEKLSEGVTRVEAVEALEKLKKLESEKPTRGELIRNALAGAAVFPAVTSIGGAVAGTHPMQTALAKRKEMLALAPAVRPKGVATTVGSALKSGLKGSGRLALGAGLSGAVLGAGLPLARQYLHSEAEKEKLRGYLGVSKRGKLRRTIKTEMGV